MENDSILFYFNCIGTVEDKRCAQYYRKGQIDSININFSRNIIDYYMNGAVALEASIIDNYLNGEAIYYHENGMVKSTGNYNQDIKTGNWTYYYDNGQLEKH